MLPGEGQSPAFCDDDGQHPAFALVEQVLRSNAGYYIGTACAECGPYARHSDYMATREAADAELLLWQTQSVKPSARTPGFWGDAE